MLNKIQKPKEPRGMVSLTLSQIVRLAGVNQTEALQLLDAADAQHVRVGSRLTYPLTEVWRALGGATGVHAGRDRLRRDLYERLLRMDGELEALRSEYVDEAQAFAITKRAIAAARKSITPAAWSGLYRRAYGQAPHPRAR